METKEGGRESRGGANRIFWCSLRGEGHVILMALSFRVLVEPLAIESKHNTKETFETKQNQEECMKAGGVIN